VPVVLAFGIPQCPGCRVLDTSLNVLEAHFQGKLRVVRLLATHPQTMEIRRRHLWPKGVSFSVNLVPVVMVVVGGEVVATLYGPRPAAELARVLGPYLPAGWSPLPTTAVEVSLLEDGSPLGPPLVLELTWQEQEALKREQPYIALVSRWKRRAF
jgi:thioredoxin-like negative regulator of GroEL